jgi:hypothetical protein
MGSESPSRRRSIDAGAAHRRHAQRGADQFPQARQINRLGRKSKAPAFSALIAVSRSAIGGDHRHRQLWVTLLDVLHQLQAGAVRQAHVGEAQIERIALSSAWASPTLRALKVSSFIRPRVISRSSRMSGSSSTMRTFCRGLVFNLVSVREQR